MLSGAAYQGRDRPLAGVAKRWESILNACAEVQQAKPTRFSKFHHSESRLGRVFISLPSWRIKLLDVDASINMPPFE
eukprot:11103470-Karenia_brevis.AAC.1